MVDHVVRAHTEGAVRWLVLDRPDRRNALAPDHRTQLVDAIRAAEGDPRVRCLVLTGAGPTFCAGGDLSTGTRDPDVHALVRNAQHLVTTLADAALPVIVAMNGDAVGMGAALALSGDVIVAATGTRFRFPFVRHGLVPDAGTAHLLPRLLPPHHAKRLLMLGEDLPAAEAHILGLVAEVVPPEDLRAVTAELADRLASGATLALALTRRLLTRGLEQDRTTALAEEARAQERAVASDDAREGLAAFAERRPPVFTGH